MKHLKPKDLAKILDIPPERISKLATEIETLTYYSFDKTPLGSFLFLKKDIPLLKEYIEISYFFGKKRYSIEMLAEKNPSIMEKQIDEKGWMKHLKNIKIPQK